MRKRLVKFGLSVSTLFRWLPSQQTIPLLLLSTPQLLVSPSIDNMGVEGPPLRRPGIPGLPCRRASLEVGSFRNGAPTSSTTFGETLEMLGHETGSAAAAAQQHQQLLCG